LLDPRDLYSPEPESFAFLLTPFSSIFWMRGGIFVVCFFDAFLAIVSPSDSALQLSEYGYLKISDAMRPLFRELAEPCAALLGIGSTSLFDELAFARGASGNIMFDSASPAE
jgi:hypothetical protein